MELTRKDVTALISTIHWLGFTHPTGHWGKMVFIYLAVAIFIITNSILYQKANWDEIDKWFDGFKGFMQYLIFFSYFLALAFDWKNSVLLTELIETGLYKWPYRCTIESSRLERQIKNDVIRFNTLWYHGISAYIVLALVAPLSVFVIRLLQHDIIDITIDMMYTPIPFYLPKNYETLQVYFVILSLQSFFFVYGMRGGYVAIVEAFNSMQLIEGELKMLRLILEEIDYTIDSILEENRLNRSICKGSSNLYVSALKTYLNDFLRRHYYVYRKVNEVSKGIQLVGFSLNSGIAILICTTIYKIVTQTDMIIILQETIYVSIIILCIYYYGAMGEKVSVADEQLRNAIYDIPWVDKPQWFKKSLQIVLTRTNRTIEIKSLGLFVLNLRNFVLTMRAVYSYYNVLNNLK